MVGKKTSWVDKFLNIIERGGNALPHPASLFGIFALLVLVFSALGAWLDWSVTHPATGETIRTVNLLSVEGLSRIIVELVHNYTSFAPLGIVMVAMMGIGIAEQSGLISALIRKLVLGSPQKILTFVVVLAGILSNIASDIGYVLLIPLAGVIFSTIGRHPFVGMAAAFAGVSGGFSANLLLGTIDPLLAGLTEESARILDPEAHVNPTANYYFMVVSTVVIAALGTWITEKLIAPRYKHAASRFADETVEPLSALEKKGLRWTGISMLFWLGLILWGILPAEGFLRGPDGGILSSPLIEGVIAFLFVVAGTAGIVYGAVTGKYKNDADVIAGMTASLKTIANYMVLVFFAAQFVAYFKWSHLGLVFSVSGAEFLLALDLGVIPLMILFILLAAVINLFMGSASAKWAILAPIFVPMFMLMGFSPELSQVVYRIGDSVTNVISPMMSFFALIIAYFQKYDEEAGIGTIIATMLPYSIAFFIGWSILISGWILLDLPLGPGATLYYDLPPGVSVP